MRTSIALLGAAALLPCLNAVAPAAMTTYYQEDFNDDANEGVRGPVPPNPATFNEGNWNVDATGATLRDGNDFAVVNGSSFQFRDIGGVSNGTPGTGTVVFETTAASIFVGNPANFTFLQMTLNAGLSAVSAGFDDLVIESLIDNVVVDSTTLNSAVGNTLVTHDLSDDITANTTHSYVLRVTATQDMNATHFIDNILVQGNSTPEPASLSMLGMGVLAMCGAGYRRRRKTEPSVG